MTQLQLCSNRYIGYHYPLAVKLMSYCNGMMHNVINTVVAMITFVHNLPYGHIAACTFFFFLFFAADVIQYLDDR